jgi:hypothetical protein
LHSFGKDQDTFLKVRNIEFSLINKDEVVSNKNIFLDQQKLAFDHIQKHMDEVVKKINTGINAPKKVKPILPSLATVQGKIAKLVEQSELEKARQKEREEEEPHFEEAKNKSEYSDGSAEDSRSKTDLSVSSPPSKMERRGSKTENKSEHTRSHRSSISNLSTADSSLKKDLIIDQKEDFDMKLSPKSAELKDIDDLKKSPIKLEDSIDHQMDTHLIRYQSEEKKSSDHEEGNTNYSFLYPIRTERRKNT